MKLFQLNFLNIIFILLVVTLILVVPSFVIETFWNSLYAANLERDLRINVFQAALLWGAFLSLIYMTGIFQFKLDLKSLESIDVDSINDPELREEIEKLKLQAKKAQDEKQTKIDKRKKR